MRFQSVTHSPCQTFHKSRVSVTNNNKTDFICQSKIIPNLSPEFIPYHIISHHVYYIHFFSNMFPHSSLETNILHQITKRPHDSHVGNFRSTNSTPKPFSWISTHLYVYRKVLHLQFTVSRFTIHNSPLTV